MSLRDVVQWHKPLDQVEPAVYRRLILVVLSPLVFVVVVVFGILGGLIDMLEVFWRSWCVDGWCGKSSQRHSDYWKRERIG